MEGLHDGDVEIWIAQPTWIDELSMAALEGILSREERERAHAFHFPHHRRDYVVSHALLRVTLARHAGGEPATLLFTSSARGRPALVGGPTGLDFSLSHTNGLATVAVTCAAAVGIDAEDFEQPGDYLELANRYLPDGERRALRALPAERRRCRFLELWTLREAYGKARGTGLSLPLDQVAFSISPGRRPSADFAPRLADERATWQFALLRPTARHVVAVARTGPWPLVPRLDSGRLPLLGAAAWVQLYTGTTV